MKKLVAISLFIFWAVVTAVLTTGLVFYQKQQSTSNLGSNLITQDKNQPTDLNKNISGNLILISEEVAKHNSITDCWLIIQNKVYDVSSYVNFHPGLAETIIPYCGKEASKAFETKNKNKPHSQEAWNLLNDYYLGDLNQKTTKQNLQKNSQKIQNSGVNLLTDKILKEFPDAKITKIKPKKNGTYKINLIYNGVNFEIKIDSAGNIIKKKNK